MSSTSEDSSRMDGDCLQPVDRRRLKRGARYALANRRDGDGCGESRDTPKSVAQAKGEALLLACDVGNINEIGEIMADPNAPNLNYADDSGRTALSIALEKNDIDLMALLIPFADERLQANALLDAISDKNEAVACTILKNMHHSCLGAGMMKELTSWVLAIEYSHGLANADITSMMLAANYELTSGVLGIEDSAVANADVTPLMLAAQRNLYEVVRFLHEIGEEISIPHPYRCICDQCVTQATVDQLRFAQRRLNAYKALAAESYLSIVSTDPIQDAFQLSGEMKEIAKVEKHFKAEYLTLAGQISEYLVKLLDRVREQSELEKILNRVDKRDSGDGEQEEPLARIQKAVDHEEKQFVAHPSCQMKLVAMWYQGAQYLEKGSMFNRLVYFLATVVIHPFLVPLYILCPNSKFVSFMDAPVVKFLAQTSWFIAFLTIIVSWSLNTSDVLAVPLAVEDYPDLIPMFKQAAEQEGFYMVRRSSVSAEELMISIWVLGFLMVEVTQLYNSGLKGHFNSLYNVLDLTMIALYFSSLSLRYTILYKVHMALEYFTIPGNLGRLEDGLDDAKLNYYWVNADRFYWDGSDPHHVAEGVFALANVITFSRVSYLLPVNELLGPLQISLGRMLYDVSRFTVIFGMVVFAFLIGLDNLFWYYNNNNRVIVELTNHTATKAGESFGSFSSALFSVFWGMFGMTDQDSINVEAYGATFTQDVGMILYGAYEVSIVIVLLNMLIAMMSQSFEQIEREASLRKHAAFRKASVHAMSVIFKDGSSEVEDTPVALTYQEVMSRIVERFIYDVTTGDECEGDSAKDDVADMRQDVTRMRREVINAISVQDNALKAMRSDLAQLTDVLGSTVKNTETQVKECNANIVQLCSTAESLNRNQEESLHMYLAITERVYHSLNVMSNHVIKTNIAPHISLTDVGGRGSGQGSGQGSGPASVQSSAHPSTEYIDEQSTQI